MTRRDRVKAALAHHQTDKVPSCIHLAGDGWEKYGQQLFDRYVTGEIRQLYDEGKLEWQHAICYAIGNDVLCVTCPWWGWYDLPESYQAEDAPDYLPKTIGCGSYGAFAEMVANLKKYTDAYVLVLIWGSHFEKAYFARGIENFLDTLENLAVDLAYGWMWWLLAAVVVVIVVRVVKKKSFRRPRLPKLGRKKKGDTPEE